MREDALIFMASAPNQSTTILSLFRREGIRDVIRNPPTLRQPTVGWDLQTLDEPRIEDASKLVVNNGPRKLIELHASGAFIASGTLPNFLGWPRDAAQFERDPRISSWALVEFAANFVLTNQALLPYLEPRPMTEHARIGVRNFVLQSGDRVYLLPGSDERFPRPREWGRAAPAANWESPPISLEVGEDRAKVERGTFLLLAQLYRWFGIEDDGIPFAIPDEQRVDLDRFLEAVAR